MKKIFFILVIFAIFFFLSKNSLIPFTGTMFDFHDQTQASRIAEFTYNLKHWQIPPRIAPHYSFNLGFPVFNYYAPFAYWITSFMNLFGIDVQNSLKLSFFLTIITGFFSMYYFLRLFFTYLPSLLGAVIYISAPYYAVEIFVRGNLSEAWFLALLPLALYILYKNSREYTRKNFFLTILILSFTLTVHNIFSLVFLLLSSIYIFLIGNYKRNYLALLLALFLSSYFLIPSLLETNLTYATEIAKRTNYMDHFLCWQQLWSAPYWGFGGSVPGCDADGMAFILGKFQVILGLAGIITLGIFFFEKKKDKRLKIYIFMFFITVIATFLTTYTSVPIWNLGKSIMALFQFPWRFLILSVFGLSFFSALLFSNKYTKMIIFVIPILIFGSLKLNSKYFYKQGISNQKYYQQYMSPDYIKYQVAYKISEYLPQTVHYKDWLNLIGKKDPTLIDNAFIHTTPPNQVISETNTPYLKIDQIHPSIALLNIHYFPLWHITINNRSYIPSRLDPLGRPIIEVLTPSTIKVSYGQTIIEILSDIISLVVITFLVLLSLNAKLWKKIRIVTK